MEKLLKDVQKRLKMTEEEFNSYGTGIEHTCKILAEEGIEFQEDFKLVFFSHMVSLMKRLNENIPLNCGDEYPEDEIDQEAIKVAEKIINPLAKQYLRNLDRMEIILASIQLQLAMEMQKENK